MSVVVHVASPIVDVILGAVSACLTHQARPGLQRVLHRILWGQQ